MQKVQGQHFEQYDGIEKHIEIWWGLETKAIGCQVDLRVYVNILTLPVSLENIVWIMFLIFFLGSAWGS